MNNLSPEKLYLRIKQIHESIFEDCSYIKTSDFYQFSSFKEKIKKRRIIRSCSII